MSVGLVGGANSDDLANAQISEGVWNRISRAVNEVANKILTLASWGGQAVKRFRGVFILKNMANIFFTPLYLYKAIVDIKRIPKLQNKTHQVHVALNAADKLKSIGDSIGPFVFALKESGLCPEINLAWASPFGGVMAGFSAFSIAKNLFSCKQLLALHKEIDSAQSSEILKDKMNEARQKNSDFFEETFDLDSNEKIKIENQELNALKTALKKHLKSEIYSHSLAATASVVSMIGSFILLCGVTGPVGWALLGLSTVMWMSSTIYRKVCAWELKPIKEDTAPQVA